MVLYYTICVALTLLIAVIVGMSAVRDSFKNQHDAEAMGLDELHPFHAKSMIEEARRKNTSLYETHSKQD